MKKALLTTIIGLVYLANAKEIPPALIKAAQEEGRIDSIGMPDSWANWGQTWQELKDKYGIEHADTDMSSGEEIQKMKSEGKNASADIGDVGMAFGEPAVKLGITQAYKTSYWDDIPNWAKDQDGHWLLAYTGTMAFIIDKNQVNPDDYPHSWQELAQKGNYKLTMGNVGVAAQSNMALLSAAYANGGDETNLEPALKYFAELAKANRLSRGEFTVAALERGEIAVSAIWDFNALSYREQIDRDRFEIIIPSDGAVISGYTTIINKHAKHPNAAKLAREYILSDAGQINLARGYARPIRSSIALPEEVKSKLLPESAYANARPIQNQKALEASLKTLGQRWQESVLSHLK